MGMENWSQLAVWVREAWLSLVQIQPVYFLLQLKTFHPQTSTRLRSEIAKGWLIARKKCSRKNGDLSWVWAKTISWMRLDDAAKIKLLECASVWILPEFWTLWEQEISKPLLQLQSNCCSRRWQPREGDRLPLRLFQTNKIALLDAQGFRTRDNKEPLLWSGKGTKGAESHKEKQNCLCFPQNEVVSMPFPKLAQSKGGKAPSSAVQKQAASKWVKEH